jgi:predicted small lipoprotein YifL
MAKPLVTLLAGLYLFAGPACGRKGPLELPPGRAPAAVEKLTAVQRGDAVVLEWTNPGKAVSGRSLGPLGEVEIWVFDGGPLPAGRALGPAEVEKTGRLVRRIPEKEFTDLVVGRGEPASEMAFRYIFDPGPSGPKSLAFTVRVLDREKRASEFSPPAAVSVRASPKPPTSILAEVRADSIAITWTAPDANIDGTKLERAPGYAVYRAEGDGLARRLTPVPVEAVRFEDRDFEFGRSYRYFVRAASSGAGGTVESADSPAAEIVPKDVFPPAPPAGLVALAGEDIVSLSWKPGTEPDLDGYRIWRKEAAQAAFAPVAGIVRGNTFVDRTVAKGVSYVYGVSALDGAGNASRPAESEPVAVKGAGA